MVTVSEALERFLSETESGDPRSTSSPASTIRLFTDFLNEFGYIGMVFQDWSIPDKRLDTSRPFCDTCGPADIDTMIFSMFVNGSVRKECKGDEAALAACQAVMANLVAWFVENGFWDAARLGELASPLVRSLTSDLCTRQAFCRVLYDHVKTHPVDEPEGLAHEDQRNGTFIIFKVVPGKLYLDFMGSGLCHVSVDWSYVDAQQPAPEPHTDVVLTLPREVTDKARRGWNLVMRVVRVQGEWRITKMQNIDE